MILPNVVALVGKLGHGKTALLNKLTGTRFPSNMGARSCTRTLQYGYTRQNEILTVDTPGFCASDDIAAHIAAQKLALEGTSLSGVYIVVKYGRSDDIAEMVNRIMTFLGDDDVRIIVTFADTASHEEGYNPTELKRHLSKTLDVPIGHIEVVGKDTSCATIESFVHGTLHEPREFSIDDNQVAAIASLSVTTRRFNKAIEEVYAKIAAASKACADMTVSGRSYETDTAIVTIQQSTTRMVQESKNRIFVEAQDLDPDQQNVIYGKAGLALSLRLKAFVDATNKSLTWDVTDPSDSRNVYKKCNYCGAVYNKTEGCDGQTRCGAVPTSTRRPRPLLVAEFEASARGWFVQYYWDGAKIQVLHVIKQLRAYMQPSQWGGNHTHVKAEGAVFESGCGMEINWSTMLPVEIKQVQLLGFVELQRPGEREDMARATFDEQVHKHKASNQRIFNSALGNRR